MRPASEIAQDCRSSADALTIEAARLQREAAAMQVEAQRRHALAALLETDDAPASELARVRTLIGMGR